MSGGAHQPWYATRLAFTATILFVAAAAPAADPPARCEPERPRLWDGHAPQCDGTFEKADGIVTVHRPEKPNGTSAVICPGGGHGGWRPGPRGAGRAIGA